MKSQLIGIAFMHALLRSPQSSKAGGQVRPGSANSNRFYIDAPSLTVGSDGVVRYILLIRAGGGASNVSFEGIRCETREQKLYAVGRSDGKWTRARDPAWRDIEYKDLNRHHGVLFAEFFCDVARKGKTLPTNAILAALKRGSSKSGTID